MTPANARDADAPGPVTILGERGKAATARQPQPAAARLKVAPGEQIGRVGPPVRRRRRAAEELVAIGGDDEWEVGVALPREDDQAHGFSAFP